MRNLTKSIFGVVSLGVLASSYSIGLANQVPNALTAEPSVSPSTVSPLPTFNAPDDDELEEDDDEYEDEDDQPVAPSASPSSSPSTTSPKTTAAPTNTKAPTTKPTASPTPTKTTPTPTATPGTGIGKEVFYRYGSIQLQAIKAGGSLSEVVILKATVRGNDWAGVPADLAQAAVAANGTKFANVSGATFTSNAFRQSLESALAAL